MYNNKYKINSISLFLGISLAFVVLIGSVPLSFSDDAILSPRKQLESGIAKENIQCRDDQVLVFRTNGNLACVTESSAEKLGWKILNGFSETRTKSQLIHYQYPLSSNDYEMPETDTIEESAYWMDTELIISKLPKIGETAEVTLIISNVHSTVGYGFDVDMTLSTNYEFVGVAEEDITMRDGKYYDYNVGVLGEISPDETREYAVTIKAVSTNIDGVIAGGSEGYGDGFRVTLLENQTLLKEDYDRLNPPKAEEQMSIDDMVPPEVGGTPGIETTTGISEESVMTEEERVRNHTNNSKTPAKQITSKDPVVITNSAPCLICPQMEFSHLPRVGEIANVTIMVGNMTDFPLGPEKNIIMEFRANPENSVEFPDLDIMQVPGRWHDSPMRDGYAMPFAMSPNTPANFTTTFKITQTGQLGFGVQIHGYDGVGVEFIVDADKTEIYNRQFTPTLATDFVTPEEIQKLRDLIEKRNGIGPEIINEDDDEILMDIIRLEGLLPEEEAEYYLGFVFRADRNYDEGSLSWRQVEHNIITDDDELASYIHAYNSIEKNPTQGHTSYYRYLGEGNGWNDGYGSTLDDIKKFLASGNYMTQSEIDQYVQDYLSDDFLGTQNNHIVDIRCTKSKGITCKEGVPEIDYEFATYSDADFTKTITQKTDFDFSNVRIPPGYVPMVYYDITFSEYVRVGDTFEVTVNWAYTIYDEEGFVEKQNIPYNYDKTIRDQKTVYVQIPSNVRFLDFEMNPGDWTIHMQEEKFDPTFRYSTNMTTYKTIMSFNYTQPQSQTFNALLESAFLEPFNEMRFDNYQIFHQDANSGLFNAQKNRAFSQQSVTTVEKFGTAEPEYDECLDCPTGIVREELRGTKTYPPLSNYQLESLVEFLIDNGLEPNRDELAQQHISESDIQKIIDLYEEKTSLNAQSNDLKTGYQHKHLF